MELNVERKVEREVERWAVELPPIFLVCVCVCIAGMGENGGSGKMYFIRYYNVLNVIFLLKLVPKLDNRKKELSRKGDAAPLLHRGFWAQISQVESEKKRKNVR